MTPQDVLEKLAMDIVRASMIGYKTLVQAISVAMERWRFFEPVNNFL